MARFIGRNGDVLEKPVEEVPLGAVVLVRPGERVPLDGVVTQGETSVNQAPITGEAAPVPKAVGDEVFAGTINETGAFEFRATKPASDTTLARIIRMVEQAQSRRAAAEQWVDRFAFYYTPAMMFLAMAVAVVPPLVMGGPWGRWFYEALVILVIACPCALVISTPVTIVAALARAAREGVLIKGGAFLEAAAHIRVVALDKTGTLTQGRPEVQRILPLDNHTERELLATAAALEAESEHALARAILRRAEKEGVPVKKAERFQAIKGKGAEGWIDGQRFWIGSHRFVHENVEEPPDVHRRAEELEDAGHSVVAIGNAEHVCGLVSLADTVRGEARQAVAAMKAAGVRRVVMLTGDNEVTAHAVAGQTGVDEVRSQLLPEDKLWAVEDLTRTHTHVAMIGDGINDAPALAAATVGIAMGAAGTDAAIETADVALMSDDLSKVPWLIGHARHTVSVIRQNVIFALSVKALFLILALAGVSTLWMAIAADMGVSLLVILNALRLLR
jgi:Cd2+/Zn2+-exporting ATPase